MSFACADSLDRVCSLRALFTNTQKLIPRYEISAVPEIAITFEAFAQSVGFISIGCNALLASQRMILLHPIPHNVVTMKRTTSLQVVLCRYPNVQYLFKRKLLTAPSL